MSANGTAKKFGFAGSAAGFVLFASFGLVNGILTGGTAAVEAGAYLTGAVGMSARLMAAGGMAAGALVAGIIFICGGFSAGWLIGAALTAAKEKDHAAVAVRTR